MEISDAAAFFDDQPVLDAYSSVVLFDGQPDLFDATTQDSEAGWRRTLSAAAISIPARGCIKLGSEVFIAGRITKDYFDGAIIREHLLLHPADSLITSGTPDKFLGVAGSVDFYAGVSWLKAKKDVERTSEASAIYDVFCSPTEGISPGMILLTPEARYLRVFAADTRSGDLAVLAAYDLGADALRSVSFVSAGTYDPVTDSSGAAAPILADAIVEFFQSNYQYNTNAATEFEISDRVVTVRQAVIVDPQPGDTLEDQSQTFRVLERQSDTDACWALHVRPV